MADIAGFPYYRAEFNKKATPVDPAQVKAVLDAVEPAAGLTDLLVVSHGWNNDMADAQNLYEALFQRFRDALHIGLVPGVANRKFAVVGVFWPSKKFAEEELIPGGAASISPAAGVAGKPALPATALTKQLDGLKGVFDHPQADQLLEQAKALVANLESSPAAQAQFADLIRQLPSRTAATSEDASDQFFTRKGDDLLKRMEAPMAAATPPAPGRPGGGGAAGGPGMGRPGTPVAAPPGAAARGQAAGIGDWFSGIKAGAANLLNFTTYYQMKERAGTIGAGPVNDLLAKVRAKNSALRIHLIGHSFGGRLVTAAAAGPQKFAPSTMTLLQAAFSHNGFSPDYDGSGTKGVFRVVVDDARVNGPILISHSDKDQAVGLAYPLASRISGEQASALGDATDKYGGIGRNGAVKTDRDAVKGVLLKAGAPGYRFERGKLYNLNADACISNHSDICRDEVAFAVLTAVAGT